MPARLPVASLCLAELLADPHRLSVPAYQRPYSWTRREADQLLEDVLAAAGVESAVAAEPDYFLGTVLLLDAEPADTPAEGGGQLRLLDIVDGQQRLVTLTILASVLRQPGLARQRPLPSCRNRRRRPRRQRRLVGGGARHQSSRAGARRAAPPTDGASPCAAPTTPS